MFALRASREPWWTLPFLAAGVTALSASLAARYAAEPALVSAVAVATVAVIAWTAWRLPRRLHSAIAVGLLPGAAVGAAAAIATVMSAGAALVANDPSVAANAWWNVGALALAAALAAASRWQLPQDAARVVPSLGAVAVLITAVGVGMSTADAWAGDIAGAASAAILIGGLLALPAALVWRESTATRVNRIGSAALATIAGASALFTVASPDESLWLPLAVSAAAAIALAIGAKWWPQICLAPAVFLCTGIAFAVTLRLVSGDGQGATVAASAVAAGVAALAMWLPLAWRAPLAGSSRRRPGRGLRPTHGGFRDLCVAVRGDDG